MENHEFTGYICEMDLRINTLIEIINSINSSIKKMITNSNENIIYAEASFLEDSDAIVGLAFIAFQIYINSTINDVMLCEKELKATVKQKKDYYKFGSLISDSDKTEIELLISLANCAKHKDESGPLHKPTALLLNEFNLLNEAYPVMQGLNLLAENNNINNSYNDLNFLFDIIEKWRKGLLNEFSKKKYRLS